MGLAAVVAHIPATSVTSNCRRKDNLFGVDESNTVSAASLRVLDVRSNFTKAIQIKRDRISALLG